MSVLSKGMLAQRRRALEVYARVLPSLDLKRRHLAVLAADERRRRAGAAAREAATLRDAAARLPMLAAEDVPLDRLCVLQAMPPAYEREMGVSLPEIVAPRWRPAPLGLLTLPPWSDAAAAALREVVALRLEVDVRERRVAALQAALQRTMQRVNLFERVLVPRARAEIRSIQVQLADLERTALVRAKLGRARVRQRRLLDVGGAGPA